MQKEGRMPLLHWIVAAVFLAVLPVKLHRLWPDLAESAS